MQSDTGTKTFRVRQEFGNFSSSVPTAYIVAFCVPWLKFLFTVNGLPYHWSYGFSEVLLLPDFSVNVLVV